MGDNLLKIMITGAAGFVGSYLAKELIKQGNQVRLIDNYFLPSNITDVEGVPIEHRDVRDRDLDFSDYNVVIHCAAISGIQHCNEHIEEAVDVNVKGTFNVLRTLKGKIIFPSSSAVYGVCQTPEIDECHPTEPRNQYGATKLQAEQLVRLHDNYTILRFSNIYGHGLFHKRTVTDMFIERALKRAPLSIHGSGTQRRDFVHIFDAARAYFLAMRDKDNEIYNIGGNEALSINDIAEATVKQYLQVTGWRLEVNHVPMDEGVKWKDFVYNSGKAKDKLRYEPLYSIYDEIRGRFKAHAEAK